MSSDYLHLFSFAAKGLQSYIMRGGKLRDMVGATSLIDKLSSREHLDHWLQDYFGIDAGSYKIRQAAAGAGRICFKRREDAEAVRRMWPVLCHGWAPDLEVVQALISVKAGEYSKALAEAAKALETARNFPAARLPEAGPFVRRAPRTGEPAVHADEKAREVDGKAELVDFTLLRKRQERDGQKRSGQLPPIAKAFGFTDSDQLPDEFSKISGDERAYLAVIHADGNNLGKMFLTAGKTLENAEGVSDENAAEFFRFISEDVVAEGTRAAVFSAVQKLPEDAKPEQQPWPLAPLVLAGDDVTVVCRADLAVPFAEEFLKAFREEMRTRLDSLRKQSFWNDVAGVSQPLEKAEEPGFPAELSAGAGIVFCTNHYPFFLAYELCESLAKQAKNTAKSWSASKSQSPPSAISFVRITGGSAPSDFEDLKDGILRGSDGAVLTGCPYFVDEAGERSVAALHEVVKAAEQLPSSTLRNLLNLQRTSAKDVPHAVTRMLEVAQSGKAEGQDPVKTFKDAWRNLTGSSSGVPVTGGAETREPTVNSQSSDWKQLRFSDSGRSHCSPLLDVLTLRFASNKAPKNSETSEPAEK